MFAKTSGTFTGDGKKWPITANRRVSSNHPSSICGANYGSSSRFKQSTVAVRLAQWALEKPVCR